MKMKLYYVVKKADGFYDEHDYDYVAGPFSFDAAYEHKGAMIKSYNYYVVEQNLEVED